MARSLTNSSSSLHWRRRSSKHKHNSGSAESFNSNSRYASPCHDEIEMNERTHLIFLPRPLCPDHPPGLVSGLHQLLHDVLACKLHVSHAQIHAVCAMCCCAAVDANMGADEGLVRDREEEMIKIKWHVFTLIFFYFLIHFLKSSGSEPAQVRSLPCACAS